MAEPSGHPGGFVKFEKPEDVQATIALRTTFSKFTVTLPPLETDNNESGDEGDESILMEDVFIRIHARVIRSDRPSSPITFATWKTSLQRPLPPQTYDGVWGEHALTYLQSTSDRTRKCGPIQLGWMICHRGGFARNLREDWDFITIPSLESGGEVVVELRLPIKKLKFQDYSFDKVRPNPGEKWEIRPSKLGLGTWWWNWGDLEGRLKDKKFKNDNWSDIDEPAEGDEWLHTQGENGEGLTFEIEGSAEIEFV